MKTLLVVLVTAAVLSSTQGGGSSNDLVVRTAQGRLRGSILTSRKGRQIYSFRGIRFAQPPVGNLRFKPPVSPESWNGIRDATEDGFACPQPINATYPTSEDCLFLNVYTTALPRSRRNPNRPVVVYFYSGGFFYNTGASSVHGPQYLLDQDIVLVTTNYRLNAFGFLSTGDNVLPGNYGMKDQVATLKWVQQNIAAFGGNPKEVTISGCSAGAVSVWHHMISPMSRDRCFMLVWPHPQHEPTEDVTTPTMKHMSVEGLFNKGISLSNGLNTMWDVIFDPFPQAQRQAGLLNCPNSTSTEIAECIGKKSVEEIISSYPGMLYWENQPILEYALVIEEDYGQERFLTENPIKSILEGNFKQVPWMTGVTKDEFNVFGFDLVTYRTFGDQFYENFEELAPVILGYERGTERSRLATQAFKEFYLNNQPISNDSMIGLGNLYSDALIRYGSDMTAKLASELSRQPVYYYEFDYQGRYSNAYLPGTETPLGVVHEDDLIYLFYMSRFPEFNSTDPETQMVEKLTTLWSNFIHTGNPTPKRSTVLNNVIWRRMTRENLEYLSIDSVLKMKTGGLYQDRMAVWDRYFPANSTL